MIAASTKPVNVAVPATANVEAISTAPSMSTTSKFVVPSTSISPEKVAPAKVVGVISAVPLKDTPPIFLAVAKAVDVAAKAIAISAEPLKLVPPMLLAVANVVAVAANPTAIFAVPSKLVPPIVLAVASAVAVAALPDVF